MRKKQRHNKEQKRSGSITCSEGTIMVWGRHVVKAVLSNPRRHVLKLYATPETQEWVQELAEQYTQISAHNQPPKIEILDKPALNVAMAGNLDPNENPVHQGIVAIIRPLPLINLHDWLEGLETSRPIVMVLDQITDGRNIGAIMRSARAFRAHAIITTTRNCPDENGNMLRAASGAAEHIPILQVVNLARSMETLKDHGFTLAGMSAQGTTPLSSLAEYDRLGIVMGAEGKGLRRLTQEHADLLLRIPIDDEAESLNVSNAAAVALYAAQRD